jgi:hypothetical protein
MLQKHMPLTNASGWVGAALGSDMVGPLLLVAYPSGNKVVSSFRVASDYVSPPVYSGNATLSMQPIAAGTKVTADSLTYTFVCSGCITGSVLSFSADEPGDVFGWAISTTRVARPSSSSSPLNFHEAGYGDYGMNFTLAKSAQYSQWAAMASGNSSGAEPSSYPVPVASSAASSVPVATGSSSPKPHSCSKKGSGTVSAISQLQSGSVSAAPNDIGSSPSSAESGAAAGTGNAPVPAAPAPPSASGASGAGAGAGGFGTGAGSSAPPFGGFPGFGGHHHHHHPNPNFTLPTPGNGMPQKYHVGGGAARLRS